MIVSPTRELASQTDKVINSIGDFMNVQTHCCIGGKSVGEDIRKLDHGVHVVSGTPGRLYDMIKRRTLRTKNIRLLVLDEVRAMTHLVYNFWFLCCAPPSIQVMRAEPDTLSVAFLFGCWFARQGGRDAREGFQGADL